MWKWLKTSRLSQFNLSWHCHKQSNANKRIEWKKKKNYINGWGNYNTISVLSSLSIITNNKQCISYMFHPDLVHTANESRRWRRREKYIGGEKERPKREYWMDYIILIHLILVMGHEYGAFNDNSLAIMNAYEYTGLWNEKKNNKKRVRSKE